MRLVFCGTPQFAVPTLKALLHAGHNIQLVANHLHPLVGIVRRDVEPALMPHCQHVGDKLVSARANNDVELSLFTQRFDKRE